MSTTSQLFGDDLLSAVFANFSRPKLKFKTTESDLMALFYRLLGRAEFKSLAKHYPFDPDGPEPRSKALADAFDSLQQSRLIGRMNPDLVIYEVSDALPLRYQKFIEPKLAGKKTLVKKLAVAVEGMLEVVK
jgi:hypothetical protein